MAKGLKGIEIKEFEPIPDGSYTVNGISEFLPNCVDVNGTPCFTLLKEELKVFVKLSTISGVEGPAMSLTPVEYIALVHALGGNTFAPTHQQRTTGAALLEGQTLATGNTFNVMAKDGWITSRAKNDNISLPIGGYTVVFKEAHRARYDGLDWNEKTYSDGNVAQYLIFDFEVTADREGNPSLWEGFIISLFMGNPFVDKKVTQEGTFDAVEDGTPVIMYNPNGRRMINFMKYFAPETIENYEWQVDPTKSVDGVCEVLNPQYPINRIAQAGKYPAKIYWEKKSGSNAKWFNLESLPQWNSEEPTIKSVASSSWSDDAPVDTMAEEPAPATQQDFAEYIMGKTWGEYDSTDIFETVTPLVLTKPVGVAWAKEYLGDSENVVGPWKAAGLPADNKFESVSPVEWAALMVEMKSRYA